MREIITKFVAAWICSFVYLYAVYSPVASVHYAHHDQYRYFAEDDHDTAAFKAEHRNDCQCSRLRRIGRPIAAELEYQIFKRVQVVADLAPIRVFGIGLAAAAMAIFASFLMRFRLAAPYAFCVAAAIFVLPAMQFSVFMASFNHPVAHILAFLSALLMRVGSRQTPALGPHRGAAACCCGGAICLLILALMAYPPSALVALLPVCAEIVLRGPAQWARVRRHFLRDACLVAVSCVLYFVIIKLYARHCGEIPEAAYQIEIDRDPLCRLEVLVFEVGNSILNFWNVLYPRASIALAVLGFLAGGALLALGRQLLRPACAKRRWRGLSDWLQMLGALACLAVFSEATFLAAPTAMNLIRMHFALAATAVLLAFGAALSWGKLIPRHWRRGAALASAAILACGAGLLAHQTVLMNCVNANMELSFLSSQLASHARGPIHRVHVIQPCDTAKAYNGLPVLPDEFNVPTAYYRQDIPWLVRAALLDAFDRASFTVAKVDHTPEGIAAARRPGTIAVTFSAPGEPVLPSPATVVVDMNDLLVLGNSPKPRLPGGLEPPAAGPNQSLRIAQAGQSARQGEK